MLTTGGAKKASRKPKKSLPIIEPTQPPKYWIGDASSACPQLSEKEMHEREEMVWTAITRGKTPVPEGKDPHLILTIGAPGSGKSTMGRLLAKYKCGDPDNYVEIDADMILDYVPEGNAIRAAKSITGEPITTDKGAVGFAYGWDRCANTMNDVTLNVLHQLYESKYNIILDGHDQETLMNAQSNGYTCSLMYVAATMATCKRRAGERAHKLGRYIGPNATADNFWGWNALVENYWNRYKARTAWFALWADNLAIVENERDDRLPGPDDFRVYTSHPPLPPEQDWRGVVNGLNAAIMAAHEACDKLAKS